jgi:alpha-amylase
VFGGLYLPHLRDSVYRNLIAAECIADELNGIFTKKNFHYNIADYNCDGSVEITVEGKTNVWIIAPHKGGSLVEWDFKPEYVNLTNVLTRRYESYHEKIKGFSHANAGGQDKSGIKTIHDVMHSKQDGLINDLNYDWHEKLSFLDHFFHPTTNLDGFSKGQFGEQGNFVLSTYGWRIHEEKNKNPTIKLFCEGRVWVDNEHCPVLINKEFEFFPDASVGITYKVTNTGSREINLWLGIECNLLLDCAHKIKELVNAQEFRWVNSSKNAEVIFMFENPVDLWKYPIETVSQSEDGYEKTFQGVTVVPQAKFTIAVASSYQLKWKIAVRSLTHD